MRPLATGSLRCLKLRPLRSILRRTDGSSVVEYALILALVAAGLITSAWLLGTAPSATFRQLAGNMQGKESRRSAPEPNSTMPTISDADSGAPQSRSVAFVVAGGIALLGICVALTALLRRRAQRAEEMTSDLVEEQLSSNCPRFVEKRQRILRALTHNMQRLANNQISVGDLMTTSPMSVTPSASVADLRDLMQSEEIRHVLVCDGPRLLGVVSDRDVRGAQPKTVKQIMSLHPITIPKSSPIMPAVTLMLERHISCLPVMDEEHVVGIITTTDVAMALQCMHQILQQWAAEKMGQPDTLSLVTCDPPLAHVG